MAKTKSPTGGQIREYLRRQGITRAHAAQLVGASISQFNDWCLPKKSKSYRPMPAGLWELLKLKTPYLED